MSSTVLDALAARRLQRALAASVLALAFIAAADNAVGEANCGPRPVHHVGSVRRKPHRHHVHAHARRRAAKATPRAPGKAAARGKTAECKPHYDVAVVLADLGHLSPVVISGPSAADADLMPLLPDPRAGFHAQFPGVQLASSGFPPPPGNGSGSSADGGGEFGGGGGSGPGGASGGGATGGTGSGGGGGGSPGGGPLPGPPPPFTPPTAVPEPATWIMMLMGMSGIGLLLRVPRGRPSPPGAG